MSNPDQPNSSPSRAGVGTRIKGAFETVHGVGENIRGRTLKAFDNMTTSGPPDNNSRHAALIDRGRTEAETGMAHMYGYADPDVYRNELTRSSNPTGKSNTTGMGSGRGNLRAGEEDSYGRNGGMNGGREADSRSARPGGQPDLEQQQPPIDWNTQMAPSTDGSSGFSPNKSPQNAGSEQRMKRDFPPELPPRSQAQPSDNGQREQMYQ